VNRRGFTLIEVVVVLLILGVVFAVAAPALTRVATIPVGGSAAPLVRLLASARRTATERGERVRVILDPPGERYWMEIDSAGAYRMLSTDTLRLLPGTRLASPLPRPCFVFTPGGEGEGDPLSVEGLRPLSVTVDRWTGEAHVQAR
jgi:prepilin-type N-terminal cleavage/methylation domain-containing protein